MLTTDADEAQAAAEVAQALAHPVRLQILDLLRDEGAYVMHLIAMLGRPQAYVSQHLAILREVGLIEDERKGMTVIYRVRDPQIFEIIDRLKVLGKLPAGVGQSAGDRQSQASARPSGSGPVCRCPHCSGQN
jgi:DNA-binding transcriptional ArsR family regulator